ncbi:IPTL-CTERM sorting domain-containing protein [Comamonadaceae bacterium OH2545_COT-014]|nr:IPTL-CTERM sorting domain-containing protein [Comamonadaceae bacterium OH2545_COT-014]
MDASVTPVPALGHGALALLGVAAAALGLRRLRRE